jgi:hypothetical protein
MDRRGWTSEIVDLVHFDKKRKSHVVTQNLEPRIVEQVLDIAAGSSGEIINAKNLVSLAEQAPAKMRPEKAGAPRDQDTSLSQQHIQFQSYVDF